MEQKNPVSLIEQIITLWCDITGMDPTSTSYHFKWGEDFSLDHVRDDLKESFKLDDTGLTSMLMMDYFADEYFAYKKLSLQELLDDNGSIPMYLEKCRLLKQMLHDESIEFAVDEFRKKLTSVLEKLSVSQDAMEKLNESGWLGYIRRDALKSIETLSVHQFSQGKPTSTYLRPAKDIFMFWNMASAVRLALHMPDCTFLALIKDQVDYASYFVLVAKNGGTVTVYTDAPRHAHPLQKYMSRRPGRDLSSRMFKNHFPYKLMDIEYDYRGDAHFGRDGLVPLQERPIVIGHINELPANEVVWLTMVLSLMDQKLYKSNYLLPTVSYCSDVLREESALNHSLTTLPAVQNYKPLIMPHNSVESLSNDSQYHKVQTSFDSDMPCSNNPNQWLEDMYKDRVPEEILNNLLEVPNHVMLMEGDSADSVSLVESKRIDAMGFFEKKDFLANRTELKMMSGDDFGSQEELEANYRFFARYNEAAYINKLVIADYKKHLPEVLEWIDSQIKSRLPEILDYIIMDRIEREHGGDGKPWTRYADIKGFNERWESWSGCNRYFLNGNRYGAMSEIKCCINEKVASYVAVFRPQNQEDLLFILNCKKEDLPIWIQHWNGHYIYSGNSILERIDPMNWVVEDLWRKMHFSFVFYFSRSSFKEACKRFKVEPNWLLPPKVN